MLVLGAAPSGMRWPVCRPTRVHDVLLQHLTAVGNTIKFLRIRFQPTAERIDRPSGKAQSSQ
jgi:hypothetical protein